MKSQHRHELQTNELGKVAEKAVNFFGTQGNRIMIGFCVVAVAASLLIYKVRSDRAREAAAWRDWSNASRAEDFKDVRDTHSGTAAARWAQLQEGQARLNEGVQLMFTNVESGTKELELAKKALHGLVDEKGAPPAIRERATFGLARCLEALSDGSDGDAVKMYEALLREFPATIYRKDAETRIAALKAGSGQEFYAWFSKYQRPKPSEKRPRDRGGDDSSELLEHLRSNLPSSMKDEDAEGDPDAELEMPDESAPIGSEAETPDDASEAGPLGDSGEESGAEESPAPEEKPEDSPADPDSP